MRTKQLSEVVWRKYKKPLGSEEQNVVNVKSEREPEEPMQYSCDMSRAFIITDIKRY